MGNVGKLEMLVAEMKQTMAKGENKALLQKSVDCACGILSLSLDFVNTDSIRSATAVVKGLSQGETHANQAWARKD